MRQDNANGLAGRWSPTVLLMSAGVLGLLGHAWIILQTPRQSYAIDDLFDALAWNLVSLGWFTVDGATPSAHVGPLYPAILAAFYAGVGHRPEWVPCLHVVLDVAASLCIYLVGRRLFHPWSDGANLRQLTSVTDPATSFCGYSIDDLARRAVFAHSGNLTGQNPGGTCQIFGIIPDGVHTPMQWTSGNAEHISPILSGNGSRAVYRVGDSLYSIPYGTTTPTLLAKGWEPSITDDGLWVYYAGGDSQLYKIPAAGGTASPLTVVPPYVYEVEVSGANTALAIGADGG